MSTFDHAKESAEMFTDATVYCEKRPRWVREVPIDGDYLRFSSVRRVFLRVPVDELARLRIARYVSARTDWDGFAYLEKRDAQLFERSKVAHAEAFTIEPVPLTDEKMAELVAQLSRRRHHP